VRDLAFEIADMLGLMNGDGGFSGMQTIMVAISAATDVVTKAIQAWRVQWNLMTGDFKEAKLWADKALERFPHDPELLAAKAVALAREGDLDGAMAFSDASMEERGDTPYIWLARGDVLLARGEKRADYCFDKARALAAADWFVHWLAARIRAFYQQFSLALRATQQALELKPDHAVLWVLAGQCQEALGLIGPARQSLQQALQLNPRAGDVSAALNRLSDAGLLDRLRSWWKTRRPR